VTELDDVIWARHSARMFLPDKPVPRELLDEELVLAMRAPSNSNTQPWRVFFTTGSGARLVDALLARVTDRPPQSASLPESFAHLRQRHGALIYGAMGIARDDTEGRWTAQLRNCARSGYKRQSGPGAGLFPLPDRPRPGPMGNRRGIHLEGAKASQIHDRPQIPSHPGSATGQGWARRCGARRQGGAGLVP
jgi:nitroreductase